MQALELYLVALAPGWLPAGLYHYGRAEHALAQLAAGAERGEWARRVPSLATVAGGTILWVLVGDAARVRRRYGMRAARFLPLEAGHLMQNLCLASAAVSWATVPLGAFFEGEIAAALALPEGDEVLYVGAFGRPGRYTGRSPDP